MSDGDDAEMETTESHYALVHILPAKTGDPYIREIVSVNAIRKFNLNDFNDKAKKESYRKKKFKIHLGPEGETNKCYVLFAAG